MSNETKPVAWMRRKPTAVPGTLREYHSLTEHKILEDDIPLYSTPPSAAAIRAMALQECAEMVERWELAHDGADGDLSLLADDMRALSPAPSVTEEWIMDVETTVYETGADPVRATLAALGIEVRK